MFYVCVCGKGWLKMGMKSHWDEMGCMREGHSYIIMEDIYIYMYVRYWVALDKPLGFRGATHLGYDR